MRPDGQLECVIESLEDTDRVGRLLVEAIPDGTTVGLVGTLGAGKTRLVQAMAVAVGIPAEDVTSPTFVLCQQYHGTRTVYHFDAYRVRDDDEFLELGPEEYFESPAISLVEWSDRVEDCLPLDRIEIQIEVTGETQRRLLVSAIGARYLKVLEVLRDRLQGQA